MGYNGSEYEEDLSWKRCYGRIYLAWESDNDNVGVGEQEIVNMVDGERIDYELGRDDRR